MGVEKQQRAYYLAMMAAHYCTELAECSTLAWRSQTESRGRHSVPILAIPPPEYSEICFSASISENIRLLFPLPFPSHLFFLPQQAKSPGLFHRTLITLDKAHRLES